MKLWSFTFTVQGEANGTREGAAAWPDILAEWGVKGKEWGTAVPVPTEGKPDPGTEVQPGEQGRWGMSFFLFSHKDVDKLNDVEKEAWTKEMMVIIHNWRKCINKLFSLWLSGEQTSRPSEQFEDFKWEPSETEWGHDQQTKRSMCVVCLTAYHKFSSSLVLQEIQKQEFSICHVLYILQQTGYCCTTDWVFTHSRPRNNKPPWRKSSEMSWMPT